MSLGWPSAWWALRAPFACGFIEVGEIVLGLALVEIGLAGKEVTLDRVEGAADAAGASAGLRWVAVAIFCCLGRRTGRGRSDRAAGLALDLGCALRSGVRLARIGGRAFRCGR